MTPESVIASEQEQSQKRLFNFTIAIGFVLYLCAALVLVAREWNNRSRQDEFGRPQSYDPEIRQYQSGETPS